MVEIYLEDKLELYTRRVTGIDEARLSKILSDYSNRYVEISNIRFEPVKRSIGLHMRSTSRIQVSYKDNGENKHTSLFLKQYTPTLEGEINGGASERSHSYNVEKEVLHFLNNIEGINPPKLIYDDSDYQILLMEDVGDTLVEDEVRNKDLETKIYWIKRSIDPLVNMHIGATKALKEQPRFKNLPIETPDQEYFTRNLIRYIDSIRENCKERTDIINFLDELRKYTEEIGEQLSSPSKKFIHGDYHVGNLVSKEGIGRPTDYKHARMGIVQSDLVDLLRHPLLQDVDPEVGMGYYFKKIFELDGEKINAKEFNHLFMYANIYRGLRGPGMVFSLQEQFPEAFLKLVKRNPEYVSYSLIYIDDAMRTFNKLFH